MRATNVGTPAWRQPRNRCFFACKGGAGDDAAGLTGSIHTHHETRLFQAGFTQWVKLYPSPRRVFSEDPPRLELRKLREFVAVLAAERPPWWVTNDPLVLEWNT